MVKNHKINMFSMRVSVCACVTVRVSSWFVCACVRVYLCTSLKVSLFVGRVCVFRVYFCAFVSLCVFSVVLLLLLISDLLVRRNLSRISSCQNRLDFTSRFKNSFYVKTIQHLLEDMSIAAYNYLKNQKLIKFN